MDKKIILENLIKKNRGLFRQLTYLNNEIKELKRRVLILERQINKEATNEAKTKTNNQSN